MNKFISLLNACYILFLIKKIERLCFIKEIKRYIKKNEKILVYQKEEKNKIE